MVIRIDEVEVRITGESRETFDPATGASGSWEGVRVRYRFTGDRRWREFLLTAQPGQGLRHVLEAAVHVVSLQERNPAGGERASARVAEATA